MESIQILKADTARHGLLMSRAYAHNTRIKMLELLEKNGTMCVGDFYEKDEAIKHLGARLEQSVVSQHLAILRRANLVATKRQGKYIHYTLSPSLHDVTATLAELANFYESAKAEAA